MAKKLTLPDLLPAVQQAVAQKLELTPELSRSVKKIEGALSDLTEAARRVQAEHGLSGAEMGAACAALTLKSIWQPPPAPEPLPADAPERWTSRDLNLKENPPLFIRRVYARWLGHGLARKDLAHLDADLYKALSVWLVRHPDDEIARLLPSQSEQIDEVIERLSAQYPVEFLRKLGYAIDSRIRRQQK